MSLPDLPLGNGRLRAPAEAPAFEPLDAPLESPSLDSCAIEVALEEPIHSPPLSEVARGARRIHLVVPDATRAGGVALLLGSVMRVLGRAGVRAEQARVVFALGLHRSPTAEERRILLGDWEGRLGIVGCEPDREEDRLDLGHTSFGTPVWVGRRALEADRLILIGSINFHYFAGFTGGRKAILPGLAASESIRANHVRVLGEGDCDRDPRVGPGRLDDNPVHLDMEEAATRAAPAFLVNSATDDAGRVVAVFAGHWRAAHRAGCEWVSARRSLVVAEPRRRVVASAGGFPRDLNLIQAHKAMEHAQAALEDGGVMVLSAECREGMGHPGFLAWLERCSEPRAFRDWLRRHYEVYAQTAFALASKLRRFRVILLSSLPRQQIEAAGMSPAADLEEALRLSRRMAGDAPGWWIPHAGSVLIRRPAA